MHPANETVAGALGDSALSKAQNGSVMRATHGVRYQRWQLDLENAMRLDSKIKATMDTRQMLHGLLGS